jgi:threonyl-tRNA synthetase
MLPRISILSLSSSAATPNTITKSHLLSARSPAHALEQLATHNPNYFVTRIRRLSPTSPWQLYDLYQEFPTTSTDATYEMEPLDFSHPVGRHIFWHSSAHVLGAALERVLPNCKLKHGPALSTIHDQDIPIGSNEGPVLPGNMGFFYEFISKEEIPNANHLTEIQKIVNKICSKEKPRFERIVFESKQQAKEMFILNEEKLRIIDTIASDSVISAYRLGNFIDLCHGPHIDRVSRIGAIKLNLPSAVTTTTTSSNNNNNNQPTYRIYGISFPNKADLLDYENRTNIALTFDHRVIGSRQKLFAFHESSPGNVFMLKHGTLVMNRLMALLRDEYQDRGFDEVSTPQLFHKSLWETSGHLEHYAKDMFFIQKGNNNNNNIDNSNDTHDSESLSFDFGLKPMNCPSHCVMFAMDGIKSHKKLPIRLADFGALHRNEKTGALSGLTRLRRFQQDDAHIFCTPEQLSTEIQSSLSFLRHIYEKTFDFNNIQIKLSTRPTKSGGTDEMWEKAETTLRQALDMYDSNSNTWIENPGDGAFYGPKIDITIKDKLGRPHQCGTIQLDFLMPERFNLEYTDGNGQIKRPIMLHRAILGSLERFMAILLEHTSGKLPFWLSPRQVIVIPLVNDDVELMKYADFVAEQLSVPETIHAGRNSTCLGIVVDVDKSSETLNKKIRNAQQAPYNLIVVVGSREKNDKTVAIRATTTTTVSDQHTTTTISENTNSNSTHPTTAITKVIPLTDLIIKCRESIDQRRNEFIPKLFII